MQCIFAYCFFLISLELFQSVRPIYLILGTFILKEGIAVFPFSVGTCLMKSKDLGPRSGVPKPGVITPFGLKRLF